MIEEGALVAAIVGGLSSSAAVDVQIHDSSGRVLRGPPRVRALSLDDLRRALGGETIHTPERTVFAIRGERGEPLVCAVFQPQKFASGQRSIADVSALFAKLRDRELTTQTIASLAVPDLADACILDVVEPHGAIRQREVAARDETARALLYKMRDYAPDPSTEMPAAIALRTGSPVLVPEVEDADLARWTNEPAHLVVLRSLAPKSTIAAPLAVRGQVIGALTLHRLTPRPFTAADLAIVDEIARFAALALENAVLFEALARAHGEAAAERDRFRQILKQAPFSIAIREGADHALEFANDRYVEITRKRDLVGRTFSESFPLWTEHLEILDHAFRSGATYANREFSTRTVDEDGLERDVYLDFVVQPLRTPSGGIDGTLSFAVDVSAQVRARHEVETLARTLAERQRWLQALLDLLPVPVMLVDATSGDVLHANKAADRIAGGTFPRASANAGHAPLYTFCDARGNPIPAERHPARRAALGEYVEGAQMDWLTPLGKKSVLTSAVLLPKQEGHPDTVIVVFDDITHLKLVEAELQKAVSVRDEFLSIASHELKTPLTTLRLQVQGLLRAARGGEQRTVSMERVSGRLDAIDRNVDRLAGLIDKLLSLPNLATGGLALDREEMDLSALLTEVLSRFGDELTRVGSELRAAIAPSVRGHWDALRLDQVMTNLMANAIKYGRGGPIHVSLEDDGVNALVVVRDSGIGIAPEDQTRIFERFERAVSERNYGGFGLGLYITRHIVLSHGGAITVESTKGAGATFQVRLPKS